MPSSVRVDTNLWHGVGLVPQPIKRGVTRDGHNACSFQVETKDGAGRPTWVRVNVYLPELVSLVNKSVRPGTRVEVYGGLMNRKRRRGSPQLTEVRAAQIMVIGKEEEDNAG